MVHPVAQKLLNGETVIRNKEGGNSMLPLIRSRQPVDIVPIKPEHILDKGTIVFVKVNGHYYTHKITAVKGNQFQIGNNHGGINGWVTREKILGLVVKIWDA